MPLHRLGAAAVIALLVAARPCTASTLAPIYTFSGSDGSDPVGIVFNNGSIYGVAGDGGAHGQGEVFRLDRGTGGTWTETTLYSFAGGSDGANPVGIAFDASGDIIGATDSGGGGTACGSGCGIVFELSPPNWTEKIIHVFKGGAKDGEQPKAAPIVHDGTAYVTTAFGGAGNGFGTVMQFKPPAAGKTNWTSKLLYSFQGGSDGALPWAPPSFGGNNLFGTTFQGGSGMSGDGGWGSVFELMPPPKGSTVWKESVPLGMDGSQGSNPLAQLLYRKGVLYGTAESGGNALNYGVVFSLSRPAGTWIQTVLYSFPTPSDGWLPTTIAFAPTGQAIYGSTATGGSATDGTLYKLTPSSPFWTKQTIWTFSGGSDGKGPNFVVFGPDGNLYGTAALGGSGNGVVFRIAP